MVKKLERTASWKPRMGAHRAAKVHTKQNSIDCDIEEDLEGEIDDKKGEYKDQMDKDESNEEDRSDKENDDHCGTKRKRDEPLGSRKKHKQLETKRHRGEEEDVNPAPLKKVRAGVSASIVRHFARVALQDKHKDRKSNVRDKEGTQKNTQSRLAVARTSAREEIEYTQSQVWYMKMTKDLGHLTAEQSNEFMALYRSLSLEQIQADIDDDEEL